MALVLINIDRKTFTGTDGEAPSFTWADRSTDRRSEADREGRPLAEGLFPLLEFFALLRESVQQGRGARSGDEDIYVGSQE